MKREKYPAKKTINLAQKESRSRDWLTLAVGLVLIACLAGAVSKFGVIDQYKRLSKAESSYNSLKSQTDALNESMADYDEVLSEYRTYSTDWLKNSEEGEYVAVNRRDVLDLLEKEVMTRGEVLGISISGDNVSIEMQGMSLSEISDMCNALETYELVEQCEFAYGETENGAGTEYSTEYSAENASGYDTENMTFRLSIALFEPEDEDADSEAEAEALLEAAGISLDETGEEAGE